MNENPLTERHNFFFALFNHILTSCRLLHNAIPAHITMSSGSDIDIPLDLLAKEQRLCNVGWIPYLVFKVSHVEEEDFGMFVSVVP